MTETDTGPDVTVDEPAAGVRRLRIGNARHRGALSVDLLAELERAILDVSAEVHCLLLTGSGETFSAGYDLRALGDPPDPAHAGATLAPDQLRVLELLDQQPLPIVTALNGPAIGGGLELALAGDIRLAVPSASLAAPTGRLGVVYSGGGLERLLAELPFAIGSELLLAGGALTAARAFALGLINRIVAADQLEKVSIQTAAQIAQLAPLSASAHRQALRALRRQGPRLPAPDRERLVAAREQALRSRDFAEGVRAFCEHRPPHFLGG